jgi:hypothetical protein
LLDHTAPEETSMPDISLPEIHLPDVKLPDGLRDMNRQDIEKAIGRIDLSKIDLPDIDLSKIDLPKAIERRLPNRRRPNPILPLAGILAVGAMFAAAWWLLTSPTAADRVRETANRAWLKVTGRQTGMVRYDEERDLASLLPNQDPDFVEPAAADDAWTSPTELTNGSPARSDVLSEPSPAR